MPFPLYPVIGAEEVTGAIATLMNRELSVANKSGTLERMETAFARFFGATYCHAFNSGTASIHSALFALGVKPGDEVLTASNTWISAIAAICHAGAIPVFCDTMPGMEHIDPAEIRRKAGPHTRAVIVTHLYGIPADMDPIMAAAREKSLKVIEDCSHAHAGKYKGRFLGRIGDIGCFSLQASKGIVAGEGGFLLTDNQLWYQRSMIPADHGARLRTELTMQELMPFSFGGGAWTYRITPASAAIALAQAGRLATLTANRQANFDRLHDRLKKSIPFLHWPTLHAGSVRGWYGTPAYFHLDTHEVTREQFIAAANAEGADLQPGAYANWYEQPIFQDLDLFGQLWTARHVNGVQYRSLPPGSLKNTDELLRRRILFPIPAEPAPVLMDQIADAVEKVAGSLDAIVDHANSQKELAVA
jgi:dTDP-4-amino-4,6-dideoxygalactose transaminase